MKNLNAIAASVLLVASAGLHAQTIVDRAKRLPIVREGLGPVLYGLGPRRSALPGQGTFAHFRRLGHIRARRPLRVAHASGRPGLDRDCRRRPRPAMGRSDRGNPARRRGANSSGRQALARRLADHRNDAHRHSGNGRRKECRLDGTGQRRAVRKIRKGVLDRMTSVRGAKR